MSSWSERYQRAFVDRELWPSGARARRALAPSSIDEAGAISGTLARLNVRRDPSFSVVLSALFGLSLLVGLFVAPSVVAAQPRRVDEDETGGGSEPGPEDEQAAEPEPAPRVATAPAAPPRVYVLSVAMEDDLEAYAQRAGAAARHELRRMSTVEWQTADRLFLGYDDSALETLERARVRLDQGRQAYLNLDLEQAITLLNGAVADFDATAGALEDPEELGESLLLLGASFAFNGQAREATRIFARLHVQMPHIVPDPNVYPPDVITRFEAARPRDSRDPQASILIESDPPGAIAYVDFVARGITPLTVTGLIGGDHIVRVTRPGATPSVSTVTVRARHQESSSAFLVDDERTAGLYDAMIQIREDDIASLGAQSWIREAARILDSERVGVIRVSRGEVEGQVGLELLVFDVASGRRLVRGAGQAPTGIGELENAVHRLVSGALEAALTSHQATDVEHVVPPPVDDESAIIVAPPVESHSIAEEWWFWTIIGGVVVVGAAVGIGVAASDTGPPLGRDPGGVVVLEF
jgi:hypothetical protein